MKTKVVRPFSRILKNQEFGAPVDDLCPKAPNPKPQTPNPNLKTQILSTKTLMLRVQPLISMDLFPVLSTIHRGVIRRKR